MTRPSLSLVFLSVFFLCVGVGMVGAVGTYPAVDDSMVLYYHFNNDSSIGENSSHIVDSSIYSINSTAYHAGYILSDHNNINRNGSIINDGYLDFNGSTFIRNITDLMTSPLNFGTGNTTYSFWIKNHGIVTNGYIFSRGQPGEDCRMATTTLACLRRGHTGGYNSTSVTLSSEIWSHIVVSYTMETETTSNMVLYYDGNEVYKTNISSFYGTISHNITSPFTIGGWSSGLNLNASIDEFIVWNRTLTEIEIKQLHYDYLNNQRIEFIDPTFANNTNTENKTVLINTSIISEGMNILDFYYNSQIYNVINSSVILYINFDNDAAIGENRTKVKDISLRNKNVTINENVSFINGIYGLAAHYNNTPKFTVSSVTTTDTVITNNQSPWTICTRFRWNDDLIINSTNIPTIIRYPSGFETGALYFSTGFGLRMNYQNTTGSNFPVDTPERTYPNIWYHICGTWNTTHITIYMDGKQGTIVETKGLANVSTTAQMRIGGDRFRGDIDYVKAWNRSLSQEEIDFEYGLNLYKTSNSTYILSLKKSTIDGVHTFNVSVTDLLGKINTTEQRIVNITTTNYELTGMYNSSLNITYRITPQFYSYGNLSMAQKGLSIFNSVYVNVTYNSELYLFRPTKGGLSLNMGNVTYTPSTSAMIVPTYIVTFSNSTQIDVLYTFTNISKDISVFNVTYILDNISFKIKIVGNDTNGYEVNWGTTGGDGLIDTPLPTFNFHGEITNLFKKGNIFFSIVPNMKISMSNYPSINYAPSAFTGNASYYTALLRYKDKLDGTRNKINDELQFVVSPNVDDLFTNIADFESSMVAPYKDVWRNSTIMASINYPSFANVSDQNRRWYNYGLRDLVFWYRSGYSEAHPTYVPLASSYGGNSGFADSLTRLSQYGYSGILYVDYWDSYPASSYYNANELVTNQIGQPSIAWTCSGTCISYATTLPYQFDMINAQEPVIKSLGVKGTYYDVFTGAQVWRYPEYNQSKVGRHTDYDIYNGSTYFNYLWMVNHSNRMREIHQYPIYSETSLLPTLGLVDYAFGMTSQLINIPNFEIFGLRPYMSFTAMLWNNSNGYNSKPNRNTLRAHIIDSFLHQRIAVAYKLDTNGWTDRDIITYYYSSNAVQREEQANNVSSILYYNNSAWITLSDLLIQDDSSFNKTKNPIIYINYTNGLQLYVNKNVSVYNVSYGGTNYSLYPNMTLVYNNNTKLFTYLGRIGDVNVSIVESIDYYFLDSDAQISWTFINQPNGTFTQRELFFDSSKQDIIMGGNQTIPNPFTFNGTIILSKNSNLLYGNQSNIKLVSGSGDIKITD